MQATDTDRGLVLRAAATGPVSPWLLVEHLVARGAASSLIEEYVKLVRARVPGLAAYASRARAHLPTVDAMAALDRARAFDAAGEPGRALAALREIHVNGEIASALSAAAAYVEAHVRDHLGESSLSCVRAALRSGEFAFDVGWMALSRDAYVLGMKRAHGSGLWEEARECALGLLALPESQADALLCCSLAPEYRRIRLQTG